MAELVHLRSVEGLSQVINLDHVVNIYDVSANTADTLLSNGQRVAAGMSASQVAQLPRLSAGTARGL